MEILILHMRSWGHVYRVLFPSARLQQRVISQFTPHSCSIRACSARRFRFTTSNVSHVALRRRLAVHTSAHVRAPEIYPTRSRDPMCPHLCL